MKDILKKRNEEELKRWAKPFTATQKVEMGKMFGTLLDEEVVTPNMLSETMREIYTKMGVYGSNI
jgi:hypothetical protein